MAATRTPTLRRLPAFLAALALLAALAGAAAPHAAAVPGNFWGVVPQATPSDEQFQRLKRGGVDSIRVPVVWAEVQPERGGAYNWSGVDLVVGRAAASRIDVLPFATGAPSWAVKTNRKLNSPQHLPVRTGLQKSGWRAFLQQAVLRYGPNGSFWAANPAIPKRPLRVWQIWNEPNFKYFVTRPNPVEYGNLVKQSYSALRSVDRGAKLILAGLFSNPAGERYSAGEFLDAMYRRVGGIKKKFHGVGLHPYTGNFKRLSPYIQDVRNTLKKHRDAGKGLWITELGWSSKRPTRGNSFAKGRGGQVKQLKGAFAMMKRNHARWKVKRIYWFSVDDQEGTCNFCDGSGLFGEGFTPKPAWKAFVRFAGGRA